MSKEKVEKYKMEKAGRKVSLKKEKRIKTLIGCACVVGAVVLAGAVGYYSGNKNGYNNGYTDGFTFAGQIYQSANASSSAITSGAAVDTNNAASASDGAVKTEKKSGK